MAAPFEVYFNELMSQKMYQIKNELYPAPKEAAYQGSKISSVLNISEKPAAYMIHSTVRDKIINIHNDATRDHIKYLGENYSHMLTNETKTIEGALRGSRACVGDLMLLEIVGHGDHKSISLSTTNESGTVITRSSSEWKKVVKIVQKVRKYGVIILQSCLGGKKVPNGSNIAEELCKVARDGVRVIANKNKRFEFAFRSFYPIDVEYEAPNKVYTTAIYYNVEGSVVKIPMKKLRSLQWGLTSSIERELILRYLANPKETTPFMLNYFKELSFCRKDFLDTEWNKILVDLEHFSLKIDPELARPSVILNRRDKERNIQEIDGQLKFPNRRKHPYQRVYIRVLSLAVLSRYEKLILEMDNNTEFSKNPASQVIYALTGEVVHGNCMQIQNMFNPKLSLGMLVRSVYKSAKEIGDDALHKFFMSGFKSPCLNGVAQDMSDLYCTFCPSEKSDFISHLTSEEDAFQYIYNFWTAKTLRELKLKEVPLNKSDKGFESYQDAMCDITSFFEVAIDLFKENELKTSGLKVSLYDVLKFAERSDMF